MATRLSGTGSRRRLAEQESENAHFTNSNYVAICHHIFHFEAFESIWPVQSQNRPRQNKQQASCHLSRNSRAAFFAKAGR